MVNRSFLSPDPPNNPLFLVLAINSATSGREFDRDSVCSRCHRWDTTAQSRYADRPTGTRSKDFCQGCALSYLDPVEIDQNALRDRLFSEWAKAKAEVEAVKAERPAGGVESMADWRGDLHFAQRQLSEAAKACFLAGFNPLKKHRRSAAKEAEK
jgi:hypothetical protein